MKSRSHTKKEPTVRIKDYNTYMRQRQWIDSLGARYQTKGQLILRLILLVLLFLFIVNNGDILTGRADERKHLRRKYNDL